MDIDQRSSQRGLQSLRFGNLLEAELGGVALEEFWLYIFKKKFFSEVTPCFIQGGPYHKAAPTKILPVYAETQIEIAGDSTGPNVE